MLLFEVLTVWLRGLAELGLEVYLAMWHLFDWRCKRRVRIRLELEIFRIQTARRQLFREQLTQKLVQNADVWI